MSSGVTVKASRSGRLLTASAQANFIAENGIPEPVVKKRKKPAQGTGASDVIAARQAGADAMIKSKAVPPSQAKPKPKQPAAPAVSKPSGAKAIGVPPMGASLPKANGLFARLATPAPQLAKPLNTTAMNTSIFAKVGPPGGAAKKAMPALSAIAAPAVKVVEPPAFEGTTPLPPGLAGTEMAVKGRKPRPKRSDLDEDRHAIVDFGNFAVRALSGTRFTYPSAAQKKAMFKAALVYALKEDDRDLSERATTAEQKIIMSRHEQVNGNLKTYVAARFPASYGLKTVISRFRRRFLKENLKVIGHLAEDGYIYGDPENRDDIYGAPIIVEVLVALYFQNRDDEGAVFESLFNPGGKGIPLETIAWILSAVHNCVDEWTTGAHVPQRFSQEKYRTHYVRLLKGLVKYQAHPVLGARCARQRKDLYQAGMLAAGAVMSRALCVTGVTDEDLSRAAARYNTSGDGSDTDNSSMDPEDEEHENDNMLDILDADVEYVTGAGRSTAALDGVLDEEMAEMEADPDAGDDDNEQVTAADPPLFTSAESDAGSEGDAGAHHGEQELDEDFGLVHNEDYFGGSQASDGPQQYVGDMGDYEQGEGEYEEEEEEEPKPPPRKRVKRRVS
ncbi:hypothetical protein EXIGLDRAFT_782058 [Exidia glandulosa HHB12029]|uniref:DUF6532 domain-containing protein n=1 Tax=Exidia glandulosa HHB12029 TaxID=1314781 RepID=A0A165B0U2_EXIGL|nr:hypothetical protein EXIGLDRAFT_782058 [Exidia glandulosa HHB12029]